MSAEEAVAIIGKEPGGWGPWDDLMAYEKPRHTLNQIDKAGKACLNCDSSGQALTEAVGAIWDWRAAHRYPLWSLHATLRNRAQRVDPKAVTSQRLKRLESILRKLANGTTMQMSQMQDIGGCRAIVANHRRMLELLYFYKNYPTQHDLRRLEDYVMEPKANGYRRAHLMYRFSGSESTQPWNKLRIEIQIRTQLQHAWATAVETVDIFTGQNLKFGKGSPKWERFFALVGSMHAIDEGSPQVPGTPDDPDELKTEIKDLENELQVIDALRSWASVTQYISHQGDEREAVGTWWRSCLSKKN